MTKSNSATGANAPIPHHGGATVKLDHNELNDNLHNLRAFTNLQEWIGNVRNYLSGIESRASHDPRFAAELKDLDFARSMIDWDEDVAEGMDALQGAIRDRIQAIQQAASQGAQQ